MEKTIDNKTVQEKVEISIRKKFHKTLFSRFTKALNEYDLIQPDDKIAVCISGGKDSMLMAKLFQELKNNNKFPFELIFWLWILAITKQIAKQLRKTVNCLAYLQKSLKQTYLKMFSKLISHLAMFVQE